MRPITKNDSQQQHPAPRFFTVITRDWGSFLAALGPPIMTSSAFVAYLMEILRGEVPDVSIWDIFQFAALIPLSGLVFMPAVLWWYYVIRRTFAIGKVVEGQVIKVDKKFVINIGLTYRFTVDGREIVANADFVNSKTVRQRTKRVKVEAIVDPRRNISFIKDFFE